MCAFAAFGGIFFGYVSGWMRGIMGMKSMGSFIGTLLSAPAFEP
jgi:hypothetical protein